MKNIILTLIVLFGLTDITLADCIDKSSPYKCKKMKIIDKEENVRIDLTCTLPALPNMPITAQDVFDSNGALKRYFGKKKTVCDVLGWRLTSEFSKFIVSI